MRRAKAALSSGSALYAPLQEKEPYQGVKVERDVKYGAADRNLLDVFLRDTASPARPVLIYVHGGGFVAGNKRTPGSPFNDNIMLWAVKNGFVGVNMTYRLAPQSPWPAGHWRHTAYPTKFLIPLRTASEVAGL